MLTGPLGRRPWRSSRTAGSGLLLAGSLLFPLWAFGSSTAGAATRAPAARGHSPATGATAPHFHPAISVKTPGMGLHASQSTNWSGYNQGVLDTGTLATSISGQWTVPTATQHIPGQAEASATWVGIGGGCLSSACTATDPTLIQAGTEQDVTANGTATYSAWWEIVPVPAITASIAVHPGDVVDCNITQTLPGLWAISLKDVTDGQGFTQTVPYISTGATAEWIEETPVVIGTSGAGVAALPNLSTVSFTGATVNGANAHLVPAQAIDLVGPTGAPVATPSTPGPTANDFNDCSYARSCPAPA